MEYSYWDIVIDHLEDEHGLIVKEITSLNTSGILTVEFSLNKEGFWAQDLEGMILEADNNDQLSISITGTRAGGETLIATPANKYIITIQGREAND